MLANILKINQSALVAESIRLNTIASNIANVDTVASSEQLAYRAKKPVFQQILSEQLSKKNNLLGDSLNGVMVNKIVDSKDPIAKVYSPDHPLADQSGYIYKNNVNIANEMADLVSASKAYQLNADVMNITRSLMQKMLNMGA